MTLGWADGNTFLPVNSSLLASSKESNLIGPACEYDGRSLAAKRRKLARMKGTDVMIELLKNALVAGHCAEYVLFDTWFSSPAQLIDVKDLGLDSIAMGEIFFFFTDELADITFGESFQIIIDAMVNSICAIFQPSEEQLALFIEMFVGGLPEYIRNSLVKAALAA